MSELDPVLSAAHIFPSAMGTEQEIGMMDDTSGKWDEPYHLVEELSQFIPAELRGVDYFLVNGFKVYPGGAVDQAQNYTFFTNLELAGPECRSPRQATIYAHAAQLLLLKIARLYAQQTSEEMGIPVNVRIQRRVIDSLSSRKACHDSYSMAIDQEQYTEHNFTPSLLYHLASRSFVTGAGLVHENRMYYAQKIGGLAKVSEYSYGGSMLRIDDEQYNSSRLEIRCNDQNISEWATEMRIGSTALVLALNKTPLQAELERHAPLIDPVHDARWMNVLRLNPDGTLRESEAQRAAVDFQRAVAELTMDKLQLYADLPLEYFEIAKELYDYCEDYIKVLHGEDTIALLADRADWALKMSLVLRRLEKDRHFGIPRRIRDIKSQAEDLRYDHIAIQADEGKIVYESLGRGHKQRAKGAFRRHVTDRELETAYAKAPPQTRANVRSELLRQYPVVSCNWDSVSVQHDKPVMIVLDDVLQTTLVDHDQKRLQNVKRIRS